MVEPGCSYHLSFPLHPCRDTSRLPLFSSDAFSISSHRLRPEPMKPRSQANVPALAPSSVTPLSPTADLQTSFPHLSSPLSRNVGFTVSLTSRLGLQWPSQAWSWSSYSIALNSGPVLLPVLSTPAFSLNQRMLPPSTQLFSGNNQLHAPPPSKPQAKRPMSPQKHDVQELPPSPSFLCPPTQPIQVHRLPAPGASPPV